MARCLVTPRADRDLDSIWSSITVVSPRAADAMIDRLTDTFDMLLTLPEAGRLRQEFRKNLRSFAVENYVIFYRTVSEGIDILRVVHGRRDIRPADVE
jgi:toxin ParE1/3/4